MDRNGNLGRSKLRESLGLSKGLQLSWLDRSRSALGMGVMEGLAYSAWNWDSLLGLG